MTSHWDVALDRTTNLLGALSLAISDRLGSHLKDEINRSGEAAAAMMVIGYVPGLSVDALRQVLRLSHPGTVRLIDRLADDGLVERKKADDGRVAALFLTRKGQSVRNQVRRRRLDILEASLDGLSENERLIFGNLIAKVLGNLPETELEKHHVCRLCAVQLCRNQCPIPGNAPILKPFQKESET